MTLEKPDYERKAMLKDVKTNRECITTPQASKRSGLSKVHLARLLRNGTLEGIQLGREWLVYTDSLEKYLATPRKSGPKGPIKKLDGKQQNEPPTKEGNS